MQKINPFLWFDHQAEEAVTFYTSLFQDSRITNTSRYGEAGPGPKGSVMSVTFQLDGQGFMALNGGPVFTFTPAISMFASRAEEPDVDRLWTELSQDGKVLMELQPYPFSRKFGWLVDRFGLSWQLNLDGRRRISPFLMFTGAQSGKAQEAMETYVSMFEGSGIHQVERFGPGQEETEGTVMHGRFSLAGQEFMAMDSRRDHGFSFTPAVSFFVNCETQPEVDDLWERLSDGGKKGQCGWLEDRYGVSWQIVPTALGTLLADKDPARSRNVMKAMLGMTKLDVAALKAAAEQ